MTNETLIKAIDEVCELNKEARRRSNDVLSKVRGQLTKKSSEEYERGLNDGWELATNVCYMSTDDRFHIFGCKAPALTLKHHTGSDAFKLYNEYMEEQKEEETTDPVLGDLVEFIHVQSEDVRRGIFISNDGLLYTTYLDPNGKLATICRERFMIKKTGEHIDIQGMLDRLKEK